jgi:hypothetical protein
MVTIPVSMYQTVVTNIGSLNDGIPVSMNAITTATETATSTTGAISNEDQVNDASTTTNSEMEDVKTVLNGTQSTSVGNSEEES